MGIKFNKSFDDARTHKLLGGRKIPFGIYPEYQSDWLKPGIYRFEHNGAKVRVNVLTGPASQITGEHRGRIYQIGVLI